MSKILIIQIKNKKSILNTKESIFLQLSFSNLYFYRIFFIFLYFLHQSRITKKYRVLRYYVKKLTNKKIIFIAVKNNEIYNEIYNKK